jgi:hypothetical protein
MRFRVIAAAFLALLFLPVIQALYPLFPVKPLDEKRAPSPFPHIEDLYAKTSDELAAGVNAWFDDRIGFRDFFIRLKNQIDYSLFGTSTKVLIGRGGWLYRRSILDHKIAVERSSPSRLAEVARLFDWLQDYAKARDMTLVVVSYPDKATLYPEQMAASFPRLPKHPNYQRIRDYLRGKPGLIYIDGEPILREESRRHRVFYKTDLHPAFYGNIAMASAIVNRLAGAMGRSGVRWKEHFEAGVFPWPGGYEANAMPRLEPQSEEIDSSAKQYELFRDTGETAWTTTAPTTWVPGIGERQVFDWMVRAKDGGKHLLPPAALFGNSFSDSWFSLGIQRYFAEIRRSRTPPERLFPFLEAMPAHVKILIYQYYEPYLLYEWPDYRAHGALARPPAAKSTNR